MEANKKEQGGKISVGLKKASKAIKMTT